MGDTEITQEVLDKAKAESQERQAEGMEFQQKLKDASDQADQDAQQEGEDTADKEPTNPGRESGQGGIITGEKGQPVSAA